MAYIYDFLKEFWGILGEMSPYLLFGFGVAGIISVIISSDTVRRHLGGSSVVSVVKASLFGIPLPLCSCGVLPVTVSLQKSGAGNGACISFLLSAPQIGVQSIAVTYALMGPVFAIVRPVTTFITGIVGGVAVNILDDTPKVKNVDKPKESCCCANQEPQVEVKAGLFDRFAKAMRYGFVTLPKDSGGAMLIGLTVAAILTAIIPNDFFADKLGTGPLTLVAMVFIGIPLYVCSSASVPIAAAMILKGLSPGAALVFLMTGPATNAASYVIVWKHFGAKTAIVYMVTVIVCAIGAGMFVDYLAFEVGLEMVTHSMFMLPLWMRNISAVILLFILFKGYYDSKKNKTAE